MTWTVLDIIGTIAFAGSGVIVAMEEEYDILGVIILGLITAFGGGVVRNLLLGIPVASVWTQGFLLKIAFLAMVIVFFLPTKWIQKSQPVMIFLDAVGVAAFAIQGALSASQLNHPLSAILVAAMLTGIGGGMIRDVFAGRKPLVLHDEIYAAWTILAGLLVGLRFIAYTNAVGLYALLAVIVTLRLLSVHYNWRLPRRSLLFK
jgi:uncharacterized membrane protein YeiH